MRDGGSWASGSAVGVGVSVGVGSRVLSGGCGAGVAVGFSVSVGVVGVGSALSSAPGNMGSRSGVGPADAESWLGCGVGVLVATDFVGSSAVGFAGSVAISVLVGWLGAVMARTTAPSSPMTGGGGALRRVQRPHPKPPRMSTQPKISIPRERAGSSFFISSHCIPTARIDMPRERAGGIFCTSSNPIQNVFPCQVTSPMV